MADDKTGRILNTLTTVLEQRKTDTSDQSYVASLYQKGIDSILKKIGEEATEVVLAAKGDKPQELIYEMADLWFHSLVLLAAKDLSAIDILNELERRFGLSGITEKRSRQQKT